MNAIFVLLGNRMGTVKLVFLRTVICIKEGTDYL